MERTGTPKGKKILLIILKIVFLLFYLAMTVFLAAGYIDVITTPEEDRFARLGVYIFIEVIILGIGGYILTLIPAVIGLIVSFIGRSSKGERIFFIIATLLPIVTESFWILLVELM